MTAERRLNASAGSVRKLFTLYAAITLVPVVLLAVVLLSLIATSTNSQALSEARAKADLIARTAIAPMLGEAQLGTTLASTQRSDVARSVDTAVRDEIVLRLRIRNLEGAVVFSDDRSGGGADDESIDAASGETVAELSYLNSDVGDAGPRGPRVVEVYQPLMATQTNARIGVLEMYLPYAPIAEDIHHGQRAILVTIGAGLLLLWVCLMGVSASVVRKLRRQSRANTFLATHDGLTGLPSRAAFTAHIRHALSALPASGPFAIGLLNLNRFRDVNDALGYTNGDELIQIIAARLSNRVRPGDVVARLNGDEFGIIFQGMANADVIESKLRELRAVVSAQVEINQIPMTVEAEVGYVIATQADAEAVSLLRQADIALKVCKTEHHGIVRFGPELDTYDSSALILVAQVADAITEGQFVMHYQPKCDLRSRSVTAVEALIRWQHPTRGLLYPDAFLGPVEQTELIDDLTRWVLRTVGDALANSDCTTTLSVAVNISARSLIRPDFANEVLTELAVSGTDPARIILEITETAILADPPRALSTLTCLAKAGFRISVDDFGAGQTSLGYLATMPISELKIDRAFVTSMDKDPRNAAIVRSVIDLGHSLGFSVTAEGVETVAVLDILTDLGCDTAQGYVLARPGPIAELEHRITAANQTMAMQPAPA